MADDFDIEAMLEAPYKKTCLMISHLYFPEYTFDSSVNCEKKVTASPLVPMAMMKAARRKDAAGVEAQAQITTEVEARIVRKAGTVVRAAAARKNVLAVKNAAAPVVMSVMGAIAVARAPIWGRNLTVVLEGRLAHPPNKVANALEAEAPLRKTRAQSGSQSIISVQRREMLVQYFACSWLPELDPETWRNFSLLWGRYVFLMNLLICIFICVGVVLTCLVFLFKVHDVRIISDRYSRRSKGIAYVEFVESSSVPLAIGLTGQRVLGVPIIVQISQAEKNRAAAAMNLQKGGAGPMRLYVGSLHFNITEDMLRGIFEPFGRIESIQLMMDSETGRSKGYGFISFADAECAKKALEQLNGFELAGRPMKVGHVTERSDASSASSFLDNDELERTGIDLGTTGRLQLMARLAEGTGLQIPAAAKQALQMSGSLPFANLPGANPALIPSTGMNQAMNLPTQPLATHCLQLSNMFNPQSENEPGWDTEIKDDVIEECNKHGGIVHIYVDKNSPQGNVYVKCPTIPAAMAAVSALHGRWFAGKMITAAYVPLPTYHKLFPDAVTAIQLLMPTRR
uniref:RRM domain-containing protein n=1 Tax=Pygocentrus nattereri TaxID=42514 RepID=A0AAR2KIT1_PYGNA